MSSFSSNGMSSSNTNYYDIDQVKFEYSISLSKTIESTQAGLLLEGTVTNLSNASWNDEFRIALRNFSIQGGAPDLDPGIRLTFHPSHLPSGKTAIFSTYIPLADLPNGSTQFEIDVLHEGHRWLSVPGQELPKIKIPQPASKDEGSDWRKVLLFVSAEVTPEARGKLELIRAVLAKYDFRSSSAVQRISKLIDERNSVYEPLRPSPNGIDASINGRTEELWKHLIVLAGYRRVQNPNAAYRQLTSTLLKEAASALGGTCPSLPDSFASWLNERAMPEAICKSRATRAMIASLDQHSRFVPGSRDLDRDLEWAFVTKYLVEHRLPPTLVPIHVSESLQKASEAVPQDVKDFPQLSNFMIRLHKDNKNFQSKYNIDLALERCAYAVDLYMVGLETEVLRHLIGSEIENWLLKPVATKLQLSPLEIILLASCSNAAHPADLFETQYYKPLQALRRQIDWLPHSSIKQEKHAVRAFGMPTSSTGLSANLNMSISALRNLRIPVSVVDAQAQLVHEASASRVETDGLDRPIDLFHLNLHDVPRLICRYADRNRPNTFRIGYALWETDIMPEEHMAGARLMDEIWVPSSYVQMVYEKAGFRNVYNVGKGIDLGKVEPRFPSGINLNKSEAFTFLMSFDLGSSVERKNPIAAVNAFQLAFRDNHDVRFVIKTNRLNYHDSDRSLQVERLLEIAESDSRIIIIAQSLPLDDFLSLIAASNAVVSPHRSEGFGYLPAYSLLLGVPVIATNYSGTTDFCTDETSFPVRFTQEFVGPKDYVHVSPGAKWAAIDERHCSERMQEVRRNYDDALARARNGSKLIKKQYSMAALTDKYMERLRNVNEQWARSGNVQ